MTGMKWTVDKMIALIDAYSEKMVQEALVTRLTLIDLKSYTLGPDALSIGSPGT